MASTPLPKLTSKIVLLSRNFSARFSIPSNPSFRPRRPASNAPVQRQSASTKPPLKLKVSAARSGVSLLYLPAEVNTRARSGGFKASSLAQTQRIPSIGDTRETMTREWWRCALWVSQSEIREYREFETDQNFQVGLSLWRQRFGPACLTRRRRTSRIGSETRLTRRSWSSAQKSNNLADLFS